MTQQDPIIKKTREVSVEQYLRRQCLSRGWECWKIDPENNRGVQDRMVLPGNGKVFFVELKREEGGQVSKMQHRRLKKMLLNGYDALILESKEEVDLFLTRIQATFYRACDAPGCVERASCGYPTGGEYYHTCGEHYRNL